MKKLFFVPLALLHCAHNVHTAAEEVVTTDQSAFLATLSSDDFKANDSNQFYSQDNPHFAGNFAVQSQDWSLAEKEYNISIPKYDTSLQEAKEKLLHLKDNSASEEEIERQKAIINSLKNTLILAKMNCAQACMAQGKASEYWTAVDDKFSVPEKNRLDVSKIGPSDVCYIFTHGYGIGDFYHAMQAALILVETTGCKGCVAMKKPFINRFLNLSRGKSIQFIDQKNKAVLSSHGYKTHLLALLGHLNLEPKQLQSQIPFDLPSHDAMSKLLKVVLPIKASGNNIAFVYRGDKRQCKIIAGRLLPYDENDIGRGLSHEPLLSLAENNKKLHFVDMGTHNPAVRLERPEHLSDRIHDFPEENEALDMFVAAADFLSNHPELAFALLSDQGPCNGFMKNINGLLKIVENIHKNVLFVCPNSKEQDMRVNYTDNGTLVEYGKEGSMHIQDISGCPYFVCNNPGNKDGEEKRREVMVENQKKMLQHAYNYFKKNRSSQNIE